MAQELNCNGLINNYYMHVCLDAETVEKSILIGTVADLGGFVRVQTNPPFFPSDQLTASNFSTPKISVLGIC